MTHDVCRRHTTLQGPLDPSLVGVVNGKCIHLHTGSITIDTDQGHTRVLTPLECAVFVGLSRHVQPLELRLMQRIIPLMLDNHAVEEMSAFLMQGEPHTYLPLNGPYYLRDGVIKMTSEAVIEEIRTRRAMPRSKNKAGLIQNVYLDGIQVRLDVLWRSEDPGTLYRIRMPWNMRCVVAGDSAGSCAQMYGLDNNMIRCQYLDGKEHRVSRHEPGGRLGSLLNRVATFTLEGVMCKGILVGHDPTDALVWVVKDLQLLDTPVDLQPNITVRTDTMVLRIDEHGRAVRLSGECKSSDITFRMDGVPIKAVLDKGGKVVDPKIASSGVWAALLEGFTTGRIELPSESLCKAPRVTPQHQLPLHVRCALHRLVQMGLVEELSSGGFERLVEHVRILGVKMSEAAPTQQASPIVCKACRGVCEARWGVVDGGLDAIRVGKLKCCDAYAHEACVRGDDVPAVCPVCRAKWQGMDMWPTHVRLADLVEQM